MKKVLILVSGGMDSMYLLHLAKQKGYEIIAATIDDAEPDHIEQDCARYIGEYFNVPLVPLRVPQPEIMMLHDHPLSEKHGTPYIVGYKMFMYAASMCYAASHGASEVWLGIYKWNSQFGDETPESIQAFTDMFRKLYPDVPEVSFVAPLYGQTKADTIREAHAAGLPLDHTYSCLVDHRKNGVVTHCGTCIACIDRKQSFAEAGVVDPTDYLA